MAGTDGVNDRVDVLLLGAGGREHALLARLAASPRAGRLWVAPGNGGMAALARVATGADGAPIDECDPAAVAGWAAAHGVGLVVVGPEAPLVAGVADAVRAAGVACFGPGAAGARMEGSKRFAKEVMARAGVPTARYRAFCLAGGNDGAGGPPLVTGEADELRPAAAAWIDELGGACVVKADGLAAGKGVVVAGDAGEARAAVDACLAGAFGAAGATVVIEELLEGPEVSLLALTDGRTLVPLAASQDHKRALDGDRGPNTGGMGVYSPVPAAGPDELAAMADAMRRVVAALAAGGVSYRGCLYGGFMLCAEGPKVLEFNARFGDPETQVVVPRMRGDLLELMLACDAGTLGELAGAASPGWADDVAVSVVLASAGYPGAYEVGKAIRGLEAAARVPGVTVYHAGTRLGEGGELLTAGGRVLDVTAVAGTFEEARARAYEACDLVEFEGKTLRRDIALRAVAG